MRDKKIEVRLNGDELARLEELRAGGSRAAAIRSLIRGVGGVAAAPEPTHDESLRVLAAMARDGKVAAAVALERALRETADEAPDPFLPDWLRE